MEKEIAEAAQDENSPQDSTVPNTQRTQTTETIELFHLEADALALVPPVREQISFYSVLNPSLLFGVGTVPFQPPRV